MKARDKFQNSYSGSFDCTCKKGFYGNGTLCNDIDECSTALNYTENIIKMTTYDNFNLSFDHIGVLNQCHSNSTCANNIGSYNCFCELGFVGDGFNCTDIDECGEEIDKCHESANCVNTYGSYNCLCFEGFFGDGFNCSDVNECEIKNSCHYYASCENFPGNYSCYNKIAFF